MSVSDARAQLPHIIERVQAGEEVTITRHGKAVAVLIRPDSVRVRRANRALAAAERLSDLIAHARTTPLHDAPTLDPRRAEELAAEVVADRAKR